ncbi:restriction endonuclease subunit S [Blautia glucerasea]|uniref:restriction endonuclease subunit S n=1 Tax=Blautia glucerasea TaxID=536633 RepID=UPI001D0635C0|nr:restriction endonuclease subunit S [Blautia glucerasea]MCB6370629.1 restriction endonuclease subunit S [Blautia glucerasea]
MKSNYDILGNHIRLIDTRNRESITDRVLGINIDKFFMPSVANVIGTDLSKYKLITKGKFACNPMHVGRDERLPVALYDEEEPAIVSPAYFMFEVVDNSILNEDYLMMWFRRPEFDRICWLHTDGSVRGGITWDDICRLELPIPPIENQLEIVNSYKAITERIALKQKINDNLEAQATALFKSWFVDYEPFETDETGKPIGWVEKSLSQVLNTTTNSVNPQKLQNGGVWHYSIPAFDSERLPVFDDPQSILSNKYVVPRNSILVSKLNPETKRIWMTSDKFENAICSTEFIVYIPNNPEHRDFYYLLFNTPEFIDFLVSNATGSTNSRMRVKPASTLDFSFFMPQDVIVLDDFCKMVQPMLDTLEKNIFEIRNLNNLTPIAVAKMMSSSC